MRANKFKPGMDRPYIIAEVGQNHNGSLGIALQYVKVFADCGADAIKFQTRNNKYLFSKEAYDRPYESRNAFGKTYGEHREYLELSRSDLETLKAACSDHGVDFMSTPFDEPSLDLLCEINVDLIKVASFDLGNLPFLKLMAETGKPMVMSVGGGNDDHIEASISEITSVHNDLAVLHCVSQYPCPHDRLNLGRINFLANRYPQVAIGSSDHFNGILSGPVAFMLGARVFEKHVTLNRAEKGTDHSFALEREGFRKFVRDINRVEGMISVNTDPHLGAEPVFQKLGKSVVAKHDLAPDTVLTHHNLSGKIFSQTIHPIRDVRKLIGRRTNKLITKGDPISLQDINDE